MQKFWTFSHSKHWVLKHVPGGKWVTNKTVAKSWSKTFHTFRICIHIDPSKLIDSLISQQIWSCSNISRSFFCGKNIQYWERESVEICIIWLRVTFNGIQKVGIKVDSSQHFLSRVPEILKSFQQRAVKCKFTD